ncbi:MAG: PBSX family phage terminase large subunit [Clostridia bacterium]|nr:PBSX family phage terminase large subunit [Clostridia bacterium]
MRRGGHAEYWLKGGRGSGKSSFAAVAVLMGILREPLANAVIYRRVAATLRDSVYALMVWAAEALGVQGLLSFKRSPPEIVYRATGQKILFRGADDPVKSKSITVSRGNFRFLWFEEMSEFRGEEDIRSIVQSVLRGSDRGVLIGTFNPPRTASHWINAACLEQRPARLIKHSTYLDMPRAWLGERFYLEAERLKTLNPRAYANEYLGEVTGTGGQVFENLYIGPLSDSELAAQDRRYFGLDFGFALDPDAFTQWAFDRKRKILWAVDEYVSAQQSPSRLAQEVLSRAGRSPVFCDSADPRMIHELRALGVNAAAAKKGPGSREHGYRWLQTLAQIRADPARTPVTARELMGFEYLRDKTGAFINAYPDGNDHTLDSCRYALEREIGARRAGTRSDVY